MPPRAWRSGLEPAKLSFRVPHFFHQTRRGTRGTMIFYDADLPGNQEIVADLIAVRGSQKRTSLSSAYDSASLGLRKRNRNPSRRVWVRAVNQTKLRRKLTHEQWSINHPVLLSWSTWGGLLKRAALPHFHQEQAMRRKKKTPIKVLICRCYRSSIQMRRELTSVLKNMS